jgi:antitoxin (DNA-binding transcriptional repressor) of toxin-antitoxin stability system
MTEHELSDPAIGPRPWPWAPSGVPARVGGRDVAPRSGAFDGATGLPVGLHKATAPLAQYARGLRKEPVILTTHGKPVAALITILDVDWETVSLSTNPRFLSVIERSRARHKAEGGLSSEEVRRLFGLPAKRRT